MRQCAGCGKYRRGVGSQGLDGGGGEGQGMSDIKTKKRLKSYFAESAKARVGVGLAAAEDVLAATAKAQNPRDSGRGFRGLPVVVCSNKSFYPAALKGCNGGLSRCAGSAISRALRH